MVKRVAVSKCLLGERCRYDGKDAYDEKLLRLLKGYKIIGVCPEELGGARNFRGPFEIKGKTEDVFGGKAKVLNIEGVDVTPFFIHGAELTLKIVKEAKIEFAILKSKSPSCSPDLIYDGTFSYKLVRGMGITAYLLRQEGIKVLSSDEFKRYTRGNNRL